MNSFTDTLKSRGFAIFVNICLWALFYLVVTGFRGRAPDYGDSKGSSTPAESPAPVANLDSLFTPAKWPRLAPAGHEPDPIYTTYFIPSQKPPPPAPTTTKITLTYEGFYETADGKRNAMVKLGSDFITGSLGGVLASNLFVASLNMQSLTLTNAARQTNVLPLDIEKQIEVPLR